MANLVVPFSIKTVFSPTTFNFQPAITLIGNPASKTITVMGTVFPYIPVFSGRVIPALLLPTGGTGGASESFGYPI